MSAPVPDSYLAHVSEAWNQMAAGRRPSADSVLALVGGSKQTAVAAMNFFWTSYLPDMLSGRTVDDVPDPVMQSAATMWQKARKIADMKAADALAQERRTLEQEREALAHKRLRHDREVRRILSGHAEELAKKDRKHEATLVQMRRAHEEDLKIERDRYARLETESKQTISSLSKSVDELRSSISDTKQELADARSELKETARKLEESRQRVTELEKDNDELLATCERRQAEARDLKARNVELVSQVEQAAIAAKEVARANEEQRNTLMASLGEMVTQAITPLKKSHEEHIKELHAAHDSRVMELKLEHDSVVTELKARIRALEAQAKRASTSGAKGGKKAEPEHKD